MTERVLLADGCRLLLTDPVGRPLIDASLGALALLGESLEFTFTPGGWPGRPGGAPAGAAPRPTDDSRSWRRGVWSGHRRGPAR